MKKWARAAFCIITASYAGGLIASYAILLAVPDALLSPDLRVYPFYFAVGIMIFTLPGAGLVAAIQNLRKHRGVVAYAETVALGTVVGGMVLWVVSPMLPTFVIGGIYGFATAVCWSLLNLAIALFERKADAASG